MVTVQNDHLSISVDPRGAELKSLYSKNTGLDYMWGGDPAYWGKTSPVLFPIIGSLKDDTCYVEGRAYHMGRHGFAREMEFDTVEQTASSALFRLRSDDHSMAKYPFPFCFDILYSITTEEIKATYIVSNTGNGDLLFSVGGHPAFKVPLVPGSDYSDHYLEFNEIENAGRWPISREGLIKTEPVPFLNNTRQLPLSRELFYQDAVIFKSLRSTSVSLLSVHSPHGLRFDYDGFPYLGIWAAKNADFVCIEPWCGIADPVNSDQQLGNKEGINKLAPGKSFERSWKVKVF